MYIRVIFCTFLFILAIPMYPLRETSYIGKLAFNKEIEFDTFIDNPFPVYFKGGIFYGLLKNNTIRFEITGSPHVNTLYLLITDQPPLPKNLKEENLCLPLKAQYKFYKFIRKIRTIEDGYEYYWHIIPSQLKSNLILPDATIIILANANLIEKVESSSWKEGMLVLLPIVYININQTNIDELIMHAHFGLLDLKNYHRQEHPITICKDNCILSMPKNILL